MLKVTYTNFGQMSTLNFDHQIHLKVGQKLLLDISFFSSLTAFGFCVQNIY